MRNKLRGIHSDLSKDTIIQGVNIESTIDMKDVLLESFKDNSSNEKDIMSSITEISHSLSEIHADIQSGRAKSPAQSSENIPEAPIICEKIENIKSEMDKLNENISKTAQKSDKILEILPNVTSMAENFESKINDAKNESNSEKRKIWKLIDNLSKELKEAANNSR